MRGHGHYGEVIGVPEGTVFRHRIDLVRAGLHSNRMRGISGSGGEAADAVIVSGGYEDDADFGDEIWYTGEGGNDVKTKGQVAHQALARGNLSLIRNLLEGIPVRVIRGFRLNSAFAPEDGYRYDGLFRVENYWQDRSKSGFRVFRYTLRKITASPSPGLPKPLLLQEEKAEYGSEDLPAPVTRQQIEVSRIIRSTETARAVKRMHHYACQVCGLCLETPGGPYAEAAHIRPLGQPHNGPDTADNILCLCPNHHLLFDLGAFTLEEDLRITGTGDSLRRVAGHRVNTEHLRYHREHFAPRP
ncbi:MAG: HNH endonuclease [Cytophagales bacterium]|nr:HNH endonuclease [Armatimonadota bacterium]